MGDRLAAFWRISAFSFSAILQKPHFEIAKKKKKKKKIYYFFFYMDIILRILTHMRKFQMEDI